MIKNSGTNKISLVFTAVSWDVLKSEGERQRMKLKNQERKKAMTEVRPRQRTETLREDQTMHILRSRVSSSVCRWVEGGVQTQCCGGMIDQLLRSLWPPPCFMFHSPWIFTFFVSLSHTSELSAVLNRNIWGVLSSGKSQWITLPGKCQTLKKTYCLLVLCRASWDYSRVIPKLATHNMSPGDIFPCSWWAYSFALALCMENVCKDFSFTLC